MSYTVFTLLLIFFFFNDTATTEIYTLSLHDALPISAQPMRTTNTCACSIWVPFLAPLDALGNADRKSTRLNSSHSQISYAVFCLKKKKKNKIQIKKNKKKNKKKTTK